MKKTYWRMALFLAAGEYVLGGGTTDYLLLVLAADKVLSEK